MCLLITDLAVLTAAADSLLSTGSAGSAQPAGSYPVTEAANAVSAR